MGFYAPGFSREPCTACGPGLTTEAMGSQAKAACVALPGWQLTGVGTAEPSPVVSPVCGLSDAMMARLF